MSGVSRHKACKLCRDRKVRCDGDQPACEKCRRLGETCVYTATSKPTKADLAQTIESLRDRIDSAESYFQRQSPSVQTSNDQLVPVPDSTVNAGPLDSPPFIMQWPSLASPTGQFSPSNSNVYQRQSISQFRNNLDSDFLNNIPMTVCNDPSGFRVDNLTLSEDSSESPLFLPSLREIRELNSTSSSSLSSVFDNSKSEKGEHAENNGRVLAELQGFSSAIFIIQAEIAGISSAVAEYLAWVRKVPGMPRTPNCAAILNTLETRVRELHEMAENRHWAAWRQTLEKLDNMGTQLGMSGAEMQKRTAEMAQYFQGSYDIGRPMEEQRPGLPPLA